MIGPIVLPWPDKRLSPNARVHWAQKSKVVKSARETAFWIVMSEAKEAVHWSSVNVTIVFHPPDRRRRDRDNMISSMKAANDGIADALGIDDSHFICTYSIGPVIKGGEVHVALSDAQNKSGEPYVMPVDA